MKLLNVIVVFLVLIVATNAWAVKGTQAVSNGLHNLSTTGVDPSDGSAGSSFYATDEDQICVFCHTPHAGSLTGPLWNRSDPGSAWSHYDAPSTYIQTLAIGRTPNDESLLCLSCQDGSISVNHLINTPNDRVTPIVDFLNGDPDNPIIDLFSGGPGSRIGASQAITNDTGDLSDDHPISFSYDLVLQENEYQPAGSKFGTLRTQAIAEAAGVRFFSGSNVECSSCHDPHVDYITDTAYAPFLITPNTGSALCLACHDK